MGEWSNPKSDSDYTNVCVQLFRALRAIFGTAGDKPARGSAADQGGPPGVHPLIKTAVESRRAPGAECPMMATPILVYIVGGIGEILTSLAAPGAETGVNCRKRTVRLGSELRFR